MNIIIGMTGLALETQLTPSQQRYLGKIQNAAEILMGLLDDILDFSKIEEGKLDFAEQPFDLKDIVSSVIEVIKVEARQKGVSVKANVADAPWAVSGDPVRMRQILLILASNAVKFTEKGKVVIEAHLEELDEGQLLVVVTVRDTGIGIAKEQLATIFDTFAQADASATRRYGGTGLGLAISNQLAKLMGGEITVESKIGEGSTFTLSLPMRKVSSVVAGSQRGEITCQNGNAARSLDILLVDQDEHQLEVAQTILEQAGHRVNKALNGLEALRCLAKFQYDLVYLSVNMPVLDGVTTAQDIRAFEKGEDVNRVELGYDIDWLSARLNNQHVFLVAVCDREEDTQALPDTLFDHQIVKPYSKDILAASENMFGK